MLEFDAIEPGDVDDRVRQRSRSLCRDVVRNRRTEPDRRSRVRLSTRSSLSRDGSPRRRRQWPAPNGDERSGRGQWRSRGAGACRTSSGRMPSTFWGGTDSIALMTVPPGQTIGFTEFVSVDPDAIDVPHDVLLPGGEIRGVVRDAETGVPLAGAEVGFTTAIPEEEPEDPDVYRTFQLGMETDAEGEFRLANLEEDEDVDVEVTLEGLFASRFCGGPTQAGRHGPRRSPRTRRPRQRNRRRRIGGAADRDRRGPRHRESGAGFRPYGDDVLGRPLRFTRRRRRAPLFSACSHAAGRSSCAEFAIDGEAAAATGSHTEDIQLTREGSPIEVRLEHSDGSEALQVVRFAIDGVAAPARRLVRRPRGGAARLR